MSNISLELDCAKAILTTYQQVNDTHSNPVNVSSRSLKPLRPHKTSNHGDREKALENEVKQLKEQYAFLQNELSNRDERLARLHRQLEEGTHHMARLQEDYENAIYQLQRKA